MSKTLRPEQWQQISPYLDEILGLCEGARSAWMESFRAEKPELAELLQDLLKEHSAAERKHFLEGTLLPAANHPSLAGQTIGPYRLISPIGEGGMGTVWLAERSDGRFERRVAVKFLRFSLASQGAAERFKREGRILGMLSHPHIAELIDAGITPNAEPYLVLEHVEGEQIDEYCDRHNLDVDRRIRLFVDVLSAVAQAHANLIVHRDIKPSNVLVRNDGQVKLLDFGIAKLLGHDGNLAPTLTGGGAFALTPQFAAPEQITGGLVTTSTDVYALGILLYLLLTGQHPAGPVPHSPADLVKAIIENEPAQASDAMIPAEAKAVAERRGTTPEKLRRDLRGDLDTIILKALKKNPAERYSSVTALADDLGRYLKHEPIRARPDTVAYRAAKFARRNRTAVALATLALVAVVAGVAGTLIQAHTARAQRDFAYRQLSRAEAVNELNSFLLSDAAPSGKPFTVNDLLGRAEHIVERQHSAGDINRVELLVSIGRQYADQEDEAAQARRLLEKAYSLSRGLSDPSTRSKASCALAGVLDVEGELLRAETLIQEGLSELPREPQYTLDRVYCLLRGAGVASQRGDSQTTITRVLAAQRLLDDSAFRSDLEDLHIFIDLAEAYRSAGRFREAIAAFEQASRLTTSLGRDDTENAGTLYNNWALALFQLGQPLAAEPIFRRAIEISRADNTDQAVSPMLLLNYGRTLRELGHLDEAADYAERAYARAKKAGHQVVMNQALLEKARIYREKGDLGRALAMLSEAEPSLRQNLPPGHYAFAALASERSLIFLERGDLENALKLANKAVAIDEAAIKAGGQGAVLLPVFLLHRSAAELEARRLDDAAADGGRALNLLQAAAQPGAFSGNLGRAYLTLGRALQAQGKREEARVDFQSAAEHLQNALGPNHPDTRAARELAGAAH